MVTKKTILIFLAFYISAVSIYAKQIKLLAIGNSFSDDAIEHYLPGLVEANGDTIIIGNMYIAGCSLEKHYNNTVNNSPDYSYRKIVDGIKTITPNYRLIDAVSDEKWDYISFQQVSSLSGLYESFFPYLDRLMDFAREHSTNPAMKIVLHATWAYAQNSTHAGFANYENNQITMFNAIIDAYNRAAQKTGIDIIIPAGTAIQNGRTSSLGDTFCRDGYHLDLNYGRYTASCVWYEKLFQKSVVGNNYAPHSITPFQIKVAQLAAHRAVGEPGKITPIEVNENSWLTITPYFHPPKEYEYSFHGYRTPLQFYNGTLVKDKTDWKKRHEEIRSRWMEMMGEWPPIIEDQPFEILETVQREDFTQHWVRFYWTPNEQTEGYLLIPNICGKKPAVITVFYEPETAAGIGGKWAMFASCLYEKFAASVWIDPGIVFDETKGSGVNYWEPWYLGYYPPPWENAWSKTGTNAKGLYSKLRKEEYDLYELHALMAPRPFLVSGGSSDPVERWIPLNHAIAVNKLLGYSHRVAMSNRLEHSPNAESNEIVYSFFEWYLK